MATVSDITIRFNFSRNCEYHTVSEDFGACDDSLESTVDDFKNDTLCDLNEDQKEEWAFDEFEVELFDAQWTDPDKFNNLDEYGEYAENVEDLGEAFDLRRDDLGDLDKRSFENSYEGCWESDEDFAQHVLNECYDVPDFLNGYIDMEKYTRDLMMDHSEYEGDDGVHIFRD